jgi:putative cardiolipin synthase
MMQRSLTAAEKTPVFSLHAKTMVIDSSIVFIGTFNFDPRSENLNTEVGAIIYDAAVAQAVENAIESDMSAGNSWNTAKDQPDQYATLGKRSKVRLLQLVPLKALL